MDTDPPKTLTDRSDAEPPAPRLRYDGAHPSPPRPMFVRFDGDPPEMQEE